MRNKKGAVPAVALAFWGVAGLMTLFALSPSQRVAHQYKRAVEKCVVDGITESVCTGIVDNMSVKERLASIRDI